MRVERVEEPREEPVAIDDQRRPGHVDIVGRRGRGRAVRRAEQPLGELGVDVGGEVDLVRVRVRVRNRVRVRVRARVRVRVTVRVRVS